MTSNLIYFDDTQLDVVDDWLEGSGSGKRSKETNTTSSIGKTGLKNASTLNQSKAGLGFRSLQPNENTKGVASKDALEKHLAKNKRKKLKTDSDANINESKKLKNDGIDVANESQIDEDDDDCLTTIHGIVEDMPISKANFLDMNNKFNKNNSKGKNNTAVKKVKDDKILSSLPATDISLNQVLPKVEDILANEMKENTASFSNDVVDNTSNNDNNSGYSKPKRHKTRSKQKNIRRDNRPDALKPSYLLPSAHPEEYRGRILTNVRTIYCYHSTYSCVIVSIIFNIFHNFHILCNIMSNIGNEDKDEYVIHGTCQIWSYVIEFTF